MTVPLDAHSQAPALQLRGWWARTIGTGDHYLVVAKDELSEGTVVEGYLLSRKPQPGVRSYRITLPRLPAEFQAEVLRDEPLTGIVVNWARIEIDEGVQAWLAASPGTVQAPPSVELHVYGGNLLTRLWLEGAFRLQFDLINGYSALPNLRAAIRHLRVLPTILA